MPSLSIISSNNHSSFMAKATGGVALIAAMYLGYASFQRVWRPKIKDMLKNVLDLTAPVAAKAELDSLKKYGQGDDKTCVRYLDRKKLIITKDPKLADYMFNSSKRHNYIHRPANNDGLKRLGMYHRGLIWNNSDSWNTVRACFQMFLNDATIKRAVSVIKEEAMNLLNISYAKSHGKSINLMEFSRRLTFRATLNAFFGLKSTDYEIIGIQESEFIASIVAYFKAWEYFLLRPERCWDPKLANQHSAAVLCLQHNVEMMLKAIDHRRVESSSSDALFVDNLHQVCKGRHDFLELYQQSALEMMLAGTDTSSVTAYYALLGIAGSKPLQLELRAELGSQNGGASSSKRTAYPLLNSIVNETLRFKPVGPVVLREAVHEDNTFPSFASVESGTAILVHLAEMNLSEDLWQEPEKFRPKRFLDQFPVRGRCKTFFPFGEGPKGCIGMHLGRREVNAILETVVLNYDMEIDGGASLESLETHWDIANQPDNPILINLKKID